MYITVLCKVVDNFGDIGVAWRLCRRLAEIQSKYKICLIVDDLESFSKIEDRLPRRCPPRNDGGGAIASETSVIARDAKQSVIIDGIEIFPWKDDVLCHEVFCQNDGERLSIVLELFQCGRPDWMEKILFEEKLKRTVQIIMIDYLTAEKYAEDFHCLQSLTRSAKVQKVNFMPGFTEATGGLVIDDQWAELPAWNKDGAVLVFTYENEWRPLAQALTEYCRTGTARRLLLAQGRGKESFMEAAKVCGAGEYIKELPYLNQSEWDNMMKKCSALVIRGEESMSRACLSGIPFIWHAYPQSDEYQLVKVRALLERMKSHFNEADFEIVENVWLDINSSNEVSFPGLSRESAPDSDVQIVPSSRTMTRNPYSAFFAALPRLVSGFQAFARSLRKNGDLAYNLMTYIEKNAIIVK